MRIGEPRVLVVATSYTRLPLEILSAKEAKRRSDCGGKHLGCPRFFVNHGADGGLQCGLSGNRATESGGHFLMLPVWQRSVCGFNGKPPHRQRGVSAWEIRPDLSRKIYPVCRRVVVANSIPLRPPGGGHPLHCVAPPLQCRPASLSPSLVSGRRFANSINELI